MDTISSILMGVTQESLPTEEEGATTTSEETNGSAILVEIKAKGKECSWKTTSLEMNTLWVDKSRTL